MPDTEYDTEYQPRHSGMEGHEPSEYDPAQLMREITGGDAVELPPRSAGSAPPSVSSFEEAGERPDWHKAAATPEPVAASWAALEDAIEAAVDAERAERALTLQQASAERTEAARVTKLTAAGQVAKPSAGRDWAGQRRHLAATAAGHRERCGRLRATYDATVLEHQPAWAARIVERLPDAKASALAALAEAGRLVERLLADATAAQALLLAPGGSLAPLAVLPVRRFVEAAQAVAGEIEASDQLGGDALVHAAMTPSWRDREQMASGIRHGVIDSSSHWLAALERSEGYRNSSFSRGIAVGERPSEDTTW